MCLPFKSVEIKPLWNYIMSSVTCTDFRCQLYSCPLSSLMRNVLINFCPFHLSKHICLGLTAALSEALTLDTSLNKISSTQTKYWAEYSLPLFLFIHRPILKNITLKTFKTISKRSVLQSNTSGQQLTVLWICYSYKWQIKASCQWINFMTVWLTMLVYIKCTQRWSIQILCLCQSMKYSDKNKDTAFKLR